MKRKCSVCGDVRKIRYFNLISIGVRSKVCFSCSKKDNNTNKPKARKNKKLPVMKLKGWPPTRSKTKFPSTVNSKRVTGGSSTVPKTRIVKGAVKNESDKKDWEVYEELVMDRFKKHGFDSEMTKIGSDNGLDVIATYKGVSVGIQVKYWGTKVGSKAVGETLMGLGAYECDYGCIISKSGYTSNCIYVSVKNNITLINDSDIRRYATAIKRAVDSGSLTGRSLEDRRLAMYIKFQAVRAERLNIKL